MKQSTSIIRILLVSFTLINIVPHASGQIMEWLEDQIRSEIESQIYGEINKAINFNSNTLGDFGGYIWESVVNTKLDSDLKENARELRNLKIDRSRLDNLPTRFPNNSKYWTTHAQITPILYNQANDYFHGVSNVKFCDVANAKLANFATTYIDSISTKGKKDFQEVTLKQSAIDTLNRCTSNQAIMDSLKNDITINPSLGLFLNNHPEVIRVYLNSILVPELRRNTRHLSYWALNADSHREMLDKKQKLINPRNLRFIPKGEGIDIINNEEVIGQIKEDKLYVYNINIMNLLGRPNTTYILDSNQWTTDEYGRVVKATQKYGKNHKGKCKQKNTLNIKKTKKTLSTKPYDEIGFYNQPDYGAPDVLLNTYFYEKNSDNKNTIKNEKKYQKNMMKQSDSNNCVSMVEYCNHHALPSAIIIDGNRITNSGLSKVSKGTTKPETKSFDISKRDRVSAVTQRINIVKSSTSPISSTLTATHQTQKKQETPKAQTSFLDFGISTFCEPLSKNTNQSAGSLGISQSVFNKIQSMKSEEDINASLLKAGFACIASEHKSIYDESISENVTYLKATYSKPVSGGKIVVKEDWMDTTIIFPNTQERDKFLATVKAEQSKGNMFTTDKAYWVGVRIETENNTIRLVALGG